MTQVAYAVVWWAVLLLIGLIAFPLTSRLCGGLQDRGYSISKVLGLLLLAYFSWILASARLVSFGYVSISVSLLLLLALSLFLGRKHLNLGNLPLRSMLISEALFAVAFGIFLFILSHKPDLYITYSEDFMDFGFLRSILRSDYFPPPDPWLAGESIPYYYGGHVVSAVLTLMSRVPPAIAYNLGVAMFFALAIGASYGLGYNLTKRKLYGLVAVVFVCLAGFISGAFQLSAFFLDEPVAGYTPVHAPHIGEWFLSFDFVTANRIIPNAVTHYPYYAYLVGDLHANVMDIPFQLMFITLLLASVRRRDDADRISRPDWVLWVFVLGLSLGFFAFVNTWSYAVYLGLAALALLLLKLNVGRKGMLGVIGLSILLFLPYHISRGPSGIRGIGLVDERTVLLDFFEIFAVFLVVTFSLLWVSGKRKLPKGKTLVVVAVIAIGTALIAFLVLFQLLLVLVPMILVPLYYIHTSRPKEETGLVLLLTLTAALAVLFCEVLFVDDALGPPYERYNTILKAYMPIWVVWAIPSAYAVFLVMSRLRRSVKAAWTGVLVVLVLAALIHPLASTTSWASGRHSQAEDGGLTLDGMAYLESTDEGLYGAIRWLNDNVDGSVVILEAPGTALEYSSPASAFTGLPTLLGWAGWEVMWRGSWDIVTERTEAADAIYEAPGGGEAIGLLTKYNVRYIYLGTLEKERYGPDVAARFDGQPGRYEPVYGNEDVRIYRVVP